MPNTGDHSHIIQIASTTSEGTWYLENLMYLFFSLISSSLSLWFSLCRLYSCLANGSPDEFQRGEQLYRMRAVKDPLQIGEP